LVMAKEDVGTARNRAFAHPTQAVGVRGALCTAVLFLTRTRRKRRESRRFVQICLIDNYDSFTFNLYHYLGELGARVVVHRNDKIATQSVIDAHPDAIVLSPGPCTPNDAGICLDLIEKASAIIPIFGVCLGHQAIGQVFGGAVVRAPVPVHGKLSLIKHRGQGVFRGINGPFQATRYHSLVVDRASMPAELTTVAETDDKLVMGLAHTKLPVHGVQFHPESISSEHGHLILKNFLDLAAAWNAAGGRRARAAVKQEARA
jgi:anthranilate synthase component 2